MEATGFVTLTLRITKEGNSFVSRCLELETASCGDSFDEALDNIKEATLEYLNAIEQLDERERVFTDKDIVIRKTRPVTVKREFELRPDAYVGSYITKIPVTV